MERLHAQQDGLLQGKVYSPCDPPRATETGVLRFSLARYLKMTNMSQEQFIEGLKPEAERNVKSQFIFEKFIEQQNMTASEEEKEAKLEEMAAELGVDKDTVKTNLGDIGMYHLQMPMLMEKAMNYLIDKAVITESEAE